MVLSAARKKAMGRINTVIGQKPIFMTKKPELYNAYTGFNYKKCHAFWDPPVSRNFTCCQAFAGEYLRFVGGPYVIGFDMNTDPAAQATGAWVDSDGTAVPQYGDICLHWTSGGAAHQHISIFLAKSPSWLTLQGGVAGSGISFMDDGIDTGGDKKDPVLWDPSALVGWMNLDILVPPKHAVPQWLKGWWSVTWDEDTYYYYFDGFWNVIWSNVAPPSPQSTVDPGDGGPGTFSIPVSGMLQINWNSGSVEQFWFGGEAQPVEFWGKHNGDGVLHGQRFIGWLD